MAASVRRECDRCFLPRHHIVQGTAAARAHLRRSHSAVRTVSRRCMVLYAGDGRVQQRKAATVSGKSDATATRALRGIRATIIPLTIAIYGSVGSVVTPT